MCNTGGTGEENPFPRRQPMKLFIAVGLFWMAVVVAAIFFVSTDKEVELQPLSEECHHIYMNSGSVPEACK